MELEQLRKMLFDIISFRTSLVLEEPKHLDDKEFCFVFMFDTDSLSETACSSTLGSFN